MIQRPGYVYTPKVPLVYCPLRLRGSPRALQSHTCREGAGGQTRPSLAVRVSPPLLLYRRCHYHRVTHRDCRSDYFSHEQARNFIIVSFRVQASTISCSVVLGVITPTRS